MNRAESFFKTIIVHEDSITGLLAIGLLKRLAAQLECALGTNINPWEICNRIWQFKWLRSPELWEEAVSKSAEADLIIISAEDHTELPAFVRSWIESVLPRMQGSPAILVALLDGSQIASIGSLPPARYLRQLAERYGVEFFCNLDDRPACVGSVVESALSGFTSGSASFSAALNDTNGRAAMNRPWIAANHLKLN